MRWTNASSSVFKLTHYQQMYGFSGKSIIDEHTQKHQTLLTANVCITFNGHFSTWTTVIRFPLHQPTPTAPGFYWLGCSFCHTTISFTWLINIQNAHRNQLILSSSTTGLLMKQALFRLHCLPSTTTNFLVPTIIHIKMYKPVHITTLGCPSCRGTDRSWPTAQHSQCSPHRVVFHLRDSASKT